MYDASAVSDADGPKFPWTCSRTEVVLLAFCLFASSKILSVSFCASSTVSSIPISKCSGIGVLAAWAAAADDDDAAADDDDATADDAAAAAGAAGVAAGAVARAAGAKLRARPLGDGSYRVFVAVLVLLVVGRVLVAALVLIAA
jgi:hypothetical protein